MKRLGILVRYKEIVYYATTQGGDKYFYLPETIKVMSDKNILVVSIRDFSVPQNGIHKRASVLLFNPETKQFKTLGIRSFDADDKELEERKFAQAAWNDIPEHSALEVLLGKINNVENEGEKSSNQRQDQIPSQKAGAGSGFFISSNIVVTNYHVINGAKQIEITYNNELKVPAVVIGSDPAGDLALLKVAGLENKVKPLILGNSIEVKE